MSDASGRTTDDVDLVYRFDAPPAVAADARLALLGGKGDSLARMTAAGLPVPPGFTLTTDACRRMMQFGYDARLGSAVSWGIEQLEATTGKRLGDPTAPLIVSVRSGAAQSMPGMMDTVLNVGVNAEVEAGLARLTHDAAFAADTRCRALRGFAEVVLQAPDPVLESLRWVEDPTSIDAMLTSAGYPVPTDPREQVHAAVRAVFHSCQSPRAHAYRQIEGIAEATGTAATVQAMVFGNLGEESGTGVAFTRDPVSGAPVLTGDFLPHAQGEDVVGGTHRTLPLAAMAERWPHHHRRLSDIAAVLEVAYADMVDLEFTVEAGVLWLLQARRGKRSPLATFRCAIDMAEDPDFPVDRVEAVARCQPYLAHPPHVLIDDDEHRSRADVAVVGRGIPASSGQATGRLCLDPDEAVRLEAAGDAVILVRHQTSPSDVQGMYASVGLFTLRGGLVSHAAVVARDWGLPAVVGASEVTIEATGVRGPGGFCAIGSVVTVDGDAGTLSSGGDTHRASRVAPTVAIIESWAAALASAPASRSANVPFAFLHAMRVKGMATRDALVAATGLPAGDIDAALAELDAAGAATFMARRSLWRLTDAGVAIHAGALQAAADPADFGALRYDDFLVANRSFKQLCTDWQLRHDEPNDHADPAYDRAVIDRLRAFDHQAESQLAVIASVLPWTAAYRPRLQAALARVEAGDVKAFTGVLCESYHDVWMELHEDLIVTQGIDRAVEGST